MGLLYEIRDWEEQGKVCRMLKFTSTVGWLYFSSVSFSVSFSAENRSKFSFSFSFTAVNGKSVFGRSLYPSLLLLVRRTPRIDYWRSKKEHAVICIGNREISTSPQLRERSKSVVPYFTANSWSYWKSESGGNYVDARGDSLIIFVETLPFHNFLTHTTSWSWSGGKGSGRRVYGQNGDKSKRRQVKTTTPKRRQKWLVKTSTNPNNTCSSSDAYIIDSIAVHIYGMQLFSYMKKVQYSIARNAWRYHETDLSPWYFTN